MCVSKTCCCGCTLKQGTKCTVISDGLYSFQNLLATIYVQSIFSYLEDLGYNVQTLRLIIWLAFFINLGRFLFGLVSSCSGFPPKLKLLHFIGHVSCDLLAVILTILAVGVSEVTWYSIVEFIFQALFVYYDWILFSFYKEDETKQKKWRTSHQSGGKQSQAHSKQIKGAILENALVQKIEDQQKEQVGGMHHPANSQSPIVAGQAACQSIQQNGVDLMQQNESPPLQPAESQPLTVSQ